MAKSKTTKRDERYDLTRRALIKWSIYAGAALGVSRTKVLEILERTGGKGLAFAANEPATTCSVHLSAGGGGLAWFQLSWPQVDIARARNPQFAWHRPGEEFTIEGTARPLVGGPDTIWSSLPAARQVTIFQCGANQTHTRFADSVLNLNGNNIFAIATALQATSPSIIPAVSIGGIDIGTAPGAARAAQVNNADGLVNLFNSAASRAGGLLSMSTDANLYKAHFDAFAQLNRAANRSTTRTAYLTASNAAQFLGTNLEAKLRVTPEDLIKYGVDGNTQTSVVALARAFIVTTKAFKMGLTNSVAMGAFENSDPHGAFADNTAMTRPPQHKRIFDAWMTDMTNTVIDSTLKPISDNLVVSIHGDTPKTCLDRAGWGDGTNGNANIVYVYSSGHLKSGWFGGTDRNGQVTGFNGNGDPAPYNGGPTARLALASIAYAIAKRDERLISPFANGIAISNKFGNPKDQ